MTSPSSVCASQVFSIDIISSQKIYFILDVSTTNGTSWVPGNITNSTSRIGTNINYTFTNAGISITQTTKFRIRYSIAADFSNPQVFEPVGGLTVTLYPTPIIADINSDPSTVICSGSTFNVTPQNISPNSIPNGTLYTWTVINNTNISGASNQTVGQSTITQALTNNSNTVQSINYAVTPTSSNGCNGDIFFVTIVVNPVPVIPSYNDAVCSGVQYSKIPNGIVPSGTTFTWGMPTSNAPHIGDLTGLAAGSSQSNVNALLTNFTNSVITASYSITATSGNCPSTNFILNLSSTPKPFIANRVDPVCSGASFNITPTNGAGNIVPVGITYSWSTPTVPTGITGGAASASNSPTSISGLLNNSTNGTLSVTYLVSTYNAGCAGSTFTETVNINPTPNIVADQYATICSNSTFSVPITNGTNLVPTGTTFSWLAPSVNGINGFQSGVNATVISGTLSNTTNATITNITYSVRPTAGACIGASFNVFVTVKPVPIIANIGPTQTGSGSYFNFPITGNIVPTGTTYSWSSPSMPTGLAGGAASGVPSPTSLTGTLNNSTAAYLDALYIITPSYLNCTGNPFVYTVRVYPKPIIANKNITSICSGQSFTVTLTDGQNGDVVPGGTTYSWNAPIVAGITGTATGTNAATISGTLNNITNYPIVVTYSVIPYANPQAGDPFDITITVNPLPISAIVVSENSGRQSNDNIICSNSSATFTAVPVVGLLTDYSYVWTVPVGVNTPSSVPSFTSSKAGTYGLRITNSTTGCVSAVQTTTSLTVNLIPNAGTITSTSNSICVGASIALKTIGDNGGTRPYIYNWTYPTIASGAASTNTSTVSISGVSPGTGDITYVILDNVGCYSNSSAAFNVKVNANPLLPTVTPVNVVYDGLSHQVIAIPASATVGTDVIEWYATSTGGSAINPTPAHTNVVSATYWAQSKNNTTGCINTNRVSETINITQKGLIITANDFQKVYDRIVYSGGNGITFKDPITGVGPGFVNGETVAVLGGSLTYSGSAQNTINAGTYKIIPGGLTANNYNITFVAGNLTVTKKVISISGFSVQDKVYDATDIATVIAGNLSGVILADLPNISFIRTAKFSSKNVGANLIITSLSTLSGSAAPNYSLDQTVNVSATITAKHINAIGVITTDKIYDGTTIALVTGGGFNTAIATGTGTSTDKTPYINDNIQFIPSGYFISKDVGNNVAITSTSTITGTDKDNYILDQPILIPRNITPKLLFMSGLVVIAPKIYDGTTTSTVAGTPALLVNEAPGVGTVMDGKSYTNDIVSITGTPIGTYNSKNVTAANSVSFSGLSLTGSNASNYSLVMQSAVTARILPKNLTMFGLSVPVSKVYDANTNTLITGSPQLQAAENSNTGNTTDGKPYIGDDIFISGTPVGNYNSSNVASASYITLSGLYLAGTDVANYTFTTQNNLLSNITPLNIKVTANPQSKTYGTDDPQLTYVSDPLIGTDTFSGVLSRTAGENAGVYSIILGSLSLNSNYKIIFFENYLTILKAKLMVTPDPINRTYGTPLPSSFTSNKFTSFGLQNGQIINSITLIANKGLGSGNDIKDGIGIYKNNLQGSLPVTGNIDLNNYEIIFDSADIIVHKLPITIIADSKQKRMSQLDPMFTYQLSRPIVSGDVFTGGLTRIPGETVGFYTILQGDLAINDNYDINYLSADLEILTIDRVIVIPNAFTPNNDGLNDMLKVMHNSTIVSINYFKVFNRSGNLIFETKNMNEGWDGKINGNIADADAYYWIVEYNTWDNKVFKVKGSTLLIK
jgi:gliding motility-associated-like protein